MTTLWLGKVQACEHLLLFGCAEVHYNQASPAASGNVTCRHQATVDRKAAGVVAGKGELMDQSHRQDADAVGDDASEEASHVKITGVSSKP